MIEKFTDEELRQIRAELAAIDHHPMKGIVCGTFKRLRELEEKHEWTRADKFNIEKFQSAIYFVLDETLGNIKMRQIRRGGHNRKMAESISNQNINNIYVDVEEYHQMFEELMSIIEKHFKWTAQIEEGK